MKKTLIAAALGLALLGSACSDITEEFNDSPKLGNQDEAALRISFPDGFGNVAAKCIGTDLLYSTRNGDGGRGVTVSPNHPWCEDGRLEMSEVRGD